MKVGSDRRTGYFKDLYAAGIEEKCDEVLSRKPNEDRLPMDYMEAQGISGMVDPDEFRAAMLCKFVETFKSGEDVPIYIMRFLADVFEDVLGGAPFDSVCQLPGRNPRSKRDRQQESNLDMERWIEHNLASFRSRVEAEAAAGDLWAKGPDVVKTTMQRLRNARLAKNVKEQIEESET